MHFGTAALSGALIVGIVAGPAQAQTAVPAAAAMPVLAATDMTAAAGPATLRSGTPVALQLMETLTTEFKSLRVGYQFRLQTAEPISVGGQIVIPTGSPVLGEVVEVRNKGMWGRSGKIGGRILYVIANGRQIRMSGRLDDKGRSGAAGAIAAVALAGIATGFFVTGTSAHVPSGTTVRGFVDEDVVVGPAPQPGFAAAPVVAAVVAPIAPPTIALPTARDVPVAPRMTASPAPAPAMGLFVPASRPVVAVATQPAPAPAPAASFVPSRPPVAIGAVATDLADRDLPLQARRYAQRDEYIRLIRQMGWAPAAAMGAVEQKYGIAMQ